MAVDIKQMQVADLASLEDDGFLYELFEGEMVRMPPPGFQHAGIVLNIGGEMWNFARKHQLGRVITNGGIVLQRDPDTLLAPDIAFFSLRQMTRNLESMPGYVEFSPELVLEVVSPSDSAAHMQGKLQKYLSCGVSVVALVWPRTKMVTVHNDDGVYGTFHLQDRLDFGNILPGFSMAVSDVFE